MGCCSSFNFQKLAGTQSLHDCEEEQIRNVEQHILNQQLQALTGKLDQGWDWPEVHAKCLQAKTTKSVPLLSSLHTGSEDNTFCSKLMLACVLTSPNSNFEKANALVTALGPLTHDSLRWLVATVLSLSTDYLPTQCLSEHPQDSALVREYLAHLSAASKEVEVTFLSELADLVPRLEKESLVKALVRSELLSCLLSSSATRRLLAKHARFGSKHPPTPMGPTAASASPRSVRRIPNDHGSESSSRINLDSSVESQQNSDHPLSPASAVSSIKESPNKDHCFLDDSFFEDFQRFRSSTTPGPLASTVSWFHTEDMVSEYWPKTPALRRKTIAPETPGNTRWQHGLNKEHALNARLTRQYTGLRLDSQQWTALGK